LSGETLMNPFIEQTIGYMYQCPMNASFIEAWFDSPVADAYDAMGVWLAGGEL